MISLIMCSNQPARFNSAAAMYKQALAGVEFELIGIHDAKSLAEGYNRAIARARGEIVILSHDDVEILSDQLPQRLSAHLQKVDLFGLAGTDKLIGPGWFNAGPPNIFGQVAHYRPDNTGFNVIIYGAPRPLVTGIHSLDGLFLAARREIFSRVKFDEITFDGFHLYDMDFSLAVYTLGLRVGVACDIATLHTSLGNYDAVWADYADRFSFKWFGKVVPRAMDPQSSFWSWHRAASKAECLDLMTPGFWNRE